MRAYADDMERIEARESLRAVTVAMIGSGNARKSNARNILREWQRKARGRIRARRATPLDLQRLGIPVTTVPAKAPDG